MKPATAFKDECVREGYVGPLYRPRFIAPLRRVDEADEGVSRLGKHLGSTWVEMRVLKLLKRWDVPSRECDRIEALAYGWDSVWRVWLPSVEGSGRAIWLGGAASHCTSRAKRYLCQERWQREKADADSSAFDDVDGGSRLPGSLRINDPTYRLSAEDAALQRLEWADAARGIRGLPPVQYSAVVGLIRGRTRAQTARLLGLSERQVRHAEGEGVRKLRASQDWNESSWEEFVLVT